MKPIRFIALGLLAFAAASTQVTALDLQAGGAPKLRVNQIQLGIISPADNLCPGTASFNVWVFANKAGTVPILVVRKGGSVSGPYHVETVESTNGLYIGTYARELNVVHPIDAEYRIVTPGSEAASNWVSLKAAC